MPMTPEKLTVKHRSQAYKVTTSKTTTVESMKQDLCCYQGLDCQAQGQGQFCRGQGQGLDCQGQGLDCQGQGQGLDAEAKAKAMVFKAKATVCT